VGCDRVLGEVCRLGLADEVLGGHTHYLSVEGRLEKPQDLQITRVLDIVHMSDVSIYQHSSAWNGLKVPHHIVYDDLCRSDNQSWIC
jgi:hypothetical protein